MTADNAVQSCLLKKQEMPNLTENSIDKGIIHGTQYSNTCSGNVATNGSLVTID